MSNGREKQIIKQRLKKLEELRKKGINPYPHKFDKKNSVKELKEKHKKLGKNKKSKSRGKTAGRVMIIRNMGKLIFADLQDSTGKMQIQLQKKETEEKHIDFFKNYIDQGDFIGVEGKIIKTKTGELTILVKNLKLLSKAILPLPEKWHGLKDKEERYRKRYLDLVMNQEVKEVFEKRTKIIKLLRKFLDEKGFIEVTTPMLQPLYGGGSAKPFKSKLNALNIQLYLAISHELYLKRLNVGGFEKVYVMNRVFRNEGIDYNHNPEFTILETMWAYKDYTANMDLFEEMIEYVVKEINGKTKIKYQGKEINFKRPWKRMTMKEAIKKYTKIDVEKASDPKLKKYLKKEGIKLEAGFRRGLAIEEIFEDKVQQKLIQPTIIYDYPSDTSPLAKQKENSELTERFEPIINGWEMGNNYSELNDPQKLKKVLLEQEEFKKKGDEEASPYDRDFIQALKHGMPPTSGLGLGVDRLVMLLTNQPSIRDVILFPFMKPKSFSKKDLEEKPGERRIGRKSNSKKEGKK